MADCVTWVAGAQTLILTTFAGLAAFCGFGVALVWLFQRQAARRLERHRETAAERLEDWRMRRGIRPTEWPGRRSTPAKED